MCTSRRPSGTVADVSPGVVLVIVDECQWVGRLCRYFDSTLKGCGMFLHLLQQKIDEFTRILFVARIWHCKCT